MDETKVIKHIVLPGGGPSGIQTLGAIQHLEKSGYWSIKNIETIYATSVGCMIAILISLQFDWQTINDYIIKRPWHEIVRLNINQVFDIFSKKGLYDLSLMHLFFKPFFDSKDISLKITMKEFFDLTNIELHFFSLEMNDFLIEDISYKTMPNIELLTGAYMSATIPLLFSPICIDKKCYVDGGILANYPLEQCIHEIGKENHNEILALKNSYTLKVKSDITSDSTIIEFINSIISNLIRRCQDSESKFIIQNEVLCECCPLTLSHLQETLNSQEKREILLQKGIEYAEEFIKHHL